MWRLGRLPSDTVALLTAELVINHWCCMSLSVPLTFSLEKGRWYSPFFQVVERSRCSGTVTRLKCCRQSKEGPGQGIGVWAPICLSLPWDLGGHGSAHHGHSGSPFIRAQCRAPAVISLRPGRHQGSIVRSPTKARGPLGSDSSVEYLREPQSRWKSVLWTACQAGRSRSSSPFSLQAQAPGTCYLLGVVLPPRFLFCCACQTPGRSSRARPVTLCPASLLSPWLVSLRDRTACQAPCVEVGL